MPAGQLTFEVLLNPSVPQDRQLELEGQVQQIYALFIRAWKTGTKVCNLDMRDIAPQYQARLYEIRRALVPHGYCIDLTERQGGLCWYEIVRLDESTFYAKKKHELRKRLLD